MKLFALFFVLTVGVLPFSARAMSSDLYAIWKVRPDLQAAFLEDGAAIPHTAAGFLMNMTDWAKQYGWQAYPELSLYRPPASPPQDKGIAPPTLASASWVVVDKKSGMVLGAQKADELWPIASITKLMTADIVTINAPNLDAWQNVYNTDDVGGAKLQVAHGAHFRLRDLVYATLVGSANNAANAIARSLGGTREDFVAHMNVRARSLGLQQTRFTDPSGIDKDNQSTAREVAYFAREIFSNNETVRQITQTYRRTIADTQGEQRQITTTNWMLYYPQYDDVWVTAGKTGFLYESGWNVVEQLRPSRYEEDKELVVVVLGSATRAESFANVERVSRWAWENYRWP